MFPLAVYLSIEWIQSLYYQGSTLIAGSTWVEVTLIGEGQPVLAYLRPGDSISSVNGQIFLLLSGYPPLQHLPGDTFTSVEPSYDAPTQQTPLFQIASLRCVWPVHQTYHADGSVHEIHFAHQ